MPAGLPVRFAVSHPRPLHHHAQCSGLPDGVAGFSVGCAISQCTDGYWLDDNGSDNTCAPCTDIDALSECRPRL